MQFKIDNAVVQETITKYRSIYEFLLNKQYEINGEIQKLINNGWEGKAKEAFIEKHKEFNEQYTNFTKRLAEHNIVLNKTVKPKVESLLTICNGFINCFDGENASFIPNRFSPFVPSFCASSNNEKLFLDYDGKQSIESSIAECTDAEYPLITKYLGEMEDLQGQLLYSTLDISGEIEDSKSDIKKEKDALLSFLSEYNKYYSGVEDLENSAVAEFGQITGITSPSVFFNTNLDVCKNGKLDISVIKSLIHKEIALEPLSEEERQTLDYIKKLLGVKEYNQIKKIIMSNPDGIDSVLTDEMMSKIINSNLQKIEFEKEKIVISGNKAGSDEDYKPQMFIETAIKQIKEWKASGDGSITWMVESDGYTEEQLKEIEDIAKMYGVNLKYIDSAEDLINHINGTDGEYDRDKTKITDISIFAHGVRDNGGILSLDYQGDDPINILSKEIKGSSINRNAFSNVHTFFGSCNMGTVTEGRSFAGEWVKKIGGTAEAVCDPTPDSVPGVGRDVDNAGGQVSFEGMYKNKDIIFKGEKYIENITGYNIGKHFCEDGCSDYPDIDYSANAKIDKKPVVDQNGNVVYKNSDVYWKEMNEDGSITIIDKGAPRR